MTQVPETRRVTDEGTAPQAAKHRHIPDLKNDVYRTLRGILQRAALLILTMCVTWELLITPFLYRYMVNEED